jgi:hypothetical protein
MSAPEKKDGRGQSQSVSWELQQHREGGPAALVILATRRGAALLDEEDDARIDAEEDHLRPRNEEYTSQSTECVRHTKATRRASRGAFAWPHPVTHHDCPHPFLPLFTSIRIGSRGSAESILHTYTSKHTQIPGRRQQEDVGALPAVDFPTPWKSIEVSASPLPRILCQTRRPPTRTCLRPSLPGARIRKLDQLPLSFFQEGVEHLLLFLLPSTLQVGWGLS